MGEKWKNPPVFYTVAEARFNKILRMEKYVPEIQDRLRLRGFPSYQKQEDLHFRVDLDNQKFQKQETSRWVFLNNTRTECYVLRLGSIAYHATGYETFQPFSDKVVDGIEDIHEVVSLACIERLGLRMLDAVTPKEGQSPECFLVESLHGTSSKIGGKFKHSFLEAVSEADGGEILASRVFTVDGGLPLPPDLHPLFLELPNRLKGLKGKNATLDNDCSTSKRMDITAKLDRNVVAESLKTLKACVNKAFYESITEFARKEWT